MMHELISLMKDNPVGTFIILLVVIYSLYSIALAYINRNKVAACECACCEEDDEEEDEVVASGHEEDEG